MTSIILHNSFITAFPNQDDYSQHQAPDLLDELYETPMGTILGENYHPLFYLWCKTGTVPDKLLNTLQNIIVNANTSL